MAKIDPSLSGQANVLAILNSTNSLSIPADAITFEAPAVKADSGDGRNTTVKVDAVAGKGYTGTVTVAYTRRGLSDSVTNPPTTDTETTGVDAATLLTKLAGELGIVAADVHLEDAATPGTPLTGAISNKPATINVVVTGGSYVYTDAASHSFAMTWNDPKIDLATAVATTDLAGFDPAS